MNNPSAHIRSFRTSSNPQHLWVYYSSSLFAWVSMLKWPRRTDLVYLQTSARHYLLRIGSGSSLERVLLSRKLRLIMKQTHKPRAGLSPRSVIAGLLPRAPTRGLLCLSVRSVMNNSQRTSLCRRIWLRQIHLDEIHHPCCCVKHCGAKTSFLMEKAG